MGSANIRIKGGSMAVPATMKETFIIRTVQKDTWKKSTCLYTSSSVSIP